VITIRQVFGIAVLIAILASIAAVGWAVPWKNIWKYLDEETDDRPAWVRTDGHTYRVALFPELFKTIGSRYGGDGKSTFAVPNIEEYDYLANDRFGAILLHRCIATRDLRDNSPAATLGWCER